MADSSASATDGFILGLPGKNRRATKGRLEKVT
jgi:hypothetical protein